MSHRLFLYEFQVAILFFLIVTKSFRIRKPNQKNASHCTGKKEKIFSKHVPGMNF